MALQDGSYRPSVKIAAGAVVCVEAEIKGDVTIGTRTIIHPKARIIAEAGPIVIGQSNLIEEQVTIINSKQSQETSSTIPLGTAMTIGDNNIFEVGCQCESLRVGDSNILESKARVGRETQLSGGCVVGAYCQLTGHQVVPENTVVFGRDCARRTQIEKPAPQTLQLDFLTKILPNYHHLKKATKAKPVEKK